MQWEGPDHSKLRELYSLVRASQSGISSPDCLHYVQTLQSLTVCVMLISTSPWTGPDLRSDYLFLPLTFNWPSFSRSGQWFTLNYITVLLPIINFTRNKTNKIAAENEHDWQAGISFVILSQNNKGTDSWRFEIFQFNKLWSSIYNVKLSVHWRPHSSTLIQACTHWTLDICNWASDVVRGLLFIKILLALLLATYYHLNCPVLEILVRMGSLLHFNFDSRFASLYNNSKMKDKSSHYNHKYHHNINEECSVSERTRDMTQLSHHWQDHHCRAHSH